MKYRLLTDEELSHLEDDFKAFLIVNGIDGVTWAKINQEDTDKALELVALFSDVVLEKVYSKIEFLEFRSKEMCMLFRVFEKETKVIFLQLKTDTVANLATPDSIHEAILKHSSDIRFKKQLKKHQNTKNEEIHELINQGCVPSTQYFWESVNRVCELA